MAKQPIAIKNSRFAERVYDLKKCASLRVLPGIGLRHALPSATDEIQKDRNRDLARTTCYEPPNKRGTIAVSRKLDNIANESNDDQNVKLKKQSEVELSKSICLNKTTQYHKQQFKQNSPRPVKIYICSARTNKLERQRAR